MAQAPDGSLFLGDERTPSVQDPATMAVWRVWPPGRYTGEGPAPLPQRLKPAGLGPPQRPACPASEPRSPWHAHLLDYLEPKYLNAVALYRLSAADGFATASGLATESDLGTKGPVAMAFDPNGHLLILDRGGHVPEREPASPRIIDVEVAPV